MRRDPRRRDGGFTLLEVMVAFVIASLATLVLYRAAFNGAGQAAVAARTQEAVVRAQSRLAAIGVLTTLRPEALSGDDGGGFRWQLRIAPAQSNGALTLYDVQVTEIFGNREVRLTTTRLGPNS
jgi:general secretion pathway protein I